ncbi:MAG: hypothetical protein DRQ49_08510 [Gammaproteobacteria bacterium]|nr:MAG: hypothetical protein DRQ41_12725 [Gammaproteobacteria bacterium]RKZ40389.1 MAG: hypothetical protein DRQ49_08510 [Gammaproteobacteria bacterium]RKZ76845.1 MAG: hypothetical protein DRQ57_02230 [Gammaproteobacteria bacterium]
MHPFFKVSLVILVFIFLTSCAAQKTVLSKYPIAFDAAVRTLADHMLEQIRDNQHKASWGQTVIVIDPFIDANSAEVIKVSQQIEQIIFEQAQNFNFALSLITPQNLRNAQYVMNGIIEFENYSVNHKAQPEKYYRLSVSVVSLKTGKIIADSKIWILDKNLNYTPVAFYQDSPMYIKDNHTESLITTAKRTVGELADNTYYNFLETKALLVEAETVYEKNDFNNALILFNEVTKRSDGELMRTYAGLYETYLKLEQTQDAEEAFSQLLALSVQKNRRLNFKFLFKVNSVEFIDAPQLRKEYSLWLRLIARYFKKNKSCFHIVGHSSKTGTVAYNDELSYLRAGIFQQRLQADFSNIGQISKVLGKGFRENLVGSGTDDAQDAIDRRVEIVVVDCSQI